MSDNPINLVVRFLLELGILAALGYWGWTQHAGAARWLLAIGAPVVAAALWGIFRVPDDGGAPVVTVPGIVRLLLEAVLFGSAIRALAAAEHPVLALVFGAITLLHYGVSYDRVLRILKG